MLGFMYRIGFELVSASLFLEFVCGCAYAHMYIFSNLIALLDCLLNVSFMLMAF